MKRATLFIITAFIAVTATAQTTASALQVKEFTLSNGLTVWLNEDHTQPKAYGAVVVRAGAKDCPNTGIAHYFEHILFKGTDKIGTVNYAVERPWLDSIAAKYDLLAQTTVSAERLEIQKDINRLSLKAGEYAIPNEFNNLISRYGGTGLNAYTSLDETVFFNTFSPQYIAQWAELNSERMLNPVFRLFQGELETVYEEKNMFLDNFLGPAIEAVQGTVYHGTPYEYSVLGSTENLKNPRLSEMREFFDKYYVAGNMGLVLCGDLCGDTIVPLLERTFGRIRRGEAPVSESVKLRRFSAGEQAKIKLPIPIIKGEGLVYQGPAKNTPDEIPFELALSLLSNDSETGLLDSLVNENRLLVTVAIVFDGTEDAGLGAIAYMPNIPFGSRKKALAMCDEQIERLKGGSFDDDALDALKKELLRDTEKSLESLSSRAALMVNAFSRGRHWGEVLDRAERIKAVTRDDIVRVAGKYLGDERLRITKKFGSYPKDKISQPGYTPVTPKNTGTKSEYAKQLEQMPHRTLEPQYIDFDRDVQTVSLAPLVTLYTAENPINDLFELQLIYRRGTKAEPLLDPLGSYLPMLGTDSLTKQQIGRAFQRIGAKMEISAGSDAFVITLSGFDSALCPSMALLAHFMDRVKPNERGFRDLISQLKIDERTFFKENSVVAAAILERVAYGDRSTYLNQITAAEMKTIGSDSLLAAFRRLQNAELTVTYSGRLPLTEVESAVRSYVHIDRVSQPHTDTYREPMAYNEPIVYFYNSPGSRQTIVGTWQRLPSLPTAADRTRLSLWDNYFGGGMSSLMFQDIREFRSLAYTAYGYTTTPSLKQHPEAPVAYTTLLSTQSDKTTQALGVLDSLFTAMPMRTENVATAKQAMINSISNNRPTFRYICNTVANLKLQGHTTDPDRGTMELLPGMDADTVASFYEENVKPATRITVIVGDKRKLDMKAFGKYGRVVELKKTDICKTGK